MARADRNVGGHPHLLCSGWALDRLLAHLQTEAADTCRPVATESDGHVARVRLEPDVGDDTMRQLISGMPPELRGRVYPNELLEVPGPVTDRAVISALPQDLVGRDAARPARALVDRADNTDGAEVTIGVVDTGMWPHPWCAGAYLAHVRDLEREDAPYNPEVARCAGHGTFVTGLILQQAPAADVRVVRAVDPSGSGRTAAVVAAIEQLAAQEVDIINLSLGTARATVGEASLLTDTIRGLAGRIVVVAAAGNRDGDEPRQFLPAALPEVIAVGAATKTKSKWQWASYSNFGPWVDFAANGEDVVSTFPVFPENGSNVGPKSPGANTFAGWAKWSGTSFATAIVSGQLACVMTSGNQPVDGFTAVGMLRDRATARTSDPLRIPVVQRRKWKLEPDGGQ